MTDKLRAAAEVALKALKSKTTLYVTWDHGVIEATEALQEALSQALAEPNTDADYWRKKAEQLEQENFGWRTKLNVRGYEIEIESLRQALAEPDTGTDRGAWSDVPDATKWVDELRGDEPDFECPRCGHCCQFVEPPNSTTDVVEPIGEIQTEQMGANAMRVIVHFYDEPPPVGTKLYAALPDVRKNRITEWQGLTDEEVDKLCMAFMGQFYKPSFARAIEGRLKEKNHG